MPAFSRKTMTKRSSGPTHWSRPVKQFLADVRGRRHQQQDERHRQPNSTASPAPQAEGGNVPPNVFTFDESTEQANLHHLMAMIRSQQEDDVGQFFGAALTTIRRFSEENREAVRRLVEREVKKIQLDEFLERIAQEGEEEESFEL